MLLPIAPDPCFNIGGLLAALRVWPVGNVVSYPAEPGANLTTPLPLLSPTNYADVYFLDGTGSFDEQHNESAQGDFYKVKLQVLVPHDTPDVAEAVQRLTGGKYLAAYQDGNGLTKLVGTKEWPLRFAADLETGKKATDRNGYPLTFSAEIPTRAPFYLAQEVGIIPTRRAWSAGFNFGFS